MNKSEELQQQIAAALNQLEKYSKDEGYPFVITGTKNMAIVFSASAQLAEISTRRIVLLTWFLAILTAALLAVEIKSVFFTKDSPAPKQNVQADTNQQVVVPPVPK